MSLLLSCQSLSKSYGAKSLFQDLDFGLFQGDRIGLVGDNGVGKSTLLKILFGIEDPCSGLVTKTKGLKICLVDQDSTLPLELTIREHLTAVLEENPAISAVDVKRRVSIAMGEMKIEDGPIKNLSGGYQKRLSILSQIIKEPDVVLFDEPTNHLDFLGVLWLQEFLARAPFAFMVVSHDRYFLEQTVSKVAEISRLYPKGICVLEGGYRAFVEKSYEYKEGLKSQAQSLSSKLKREEEWLSRGPKARGTKSKSRIEAASELKENLKDVKGRLSENKLGIDFSSTGRKSRKLIEAENLTIGYDGASLLEGLDLTLKNGSIVGICGPNGCGKSTLLKVMAKLIAPLSGRLQFATDLKVTYFDQKREELDLEATLSSALTDETGGVTYNNRSFHVNAWASKFGFTNEKLSLKVKELSGGEKARLLISRLVRREADILLLDEPTNDLDITTLKVLEESLENFKGAILLISHDRYLVSNLCDSIIGFVDGKKAHVYGDYEQWEEDFLRSLKNKNTVKKTPKKKKTPPKKTAQKKRSYMEQREFDQMEDKILEAEGHLEKARTLTEDPIVLQDGKKAKEAFEDLHQAQKEVERLYERWAELSE